MACPSFAVQVATLLLAIAPAAAQNRSLITPFDVSGVAFCAPQVLEALEQGRALDFERFRIIGQTLDCRNQREYLFSAALRANQGEAARYIMSSLPADSPQFRAHDNEGKTPLFLASEIGDEAIVRYLLCAPSLLGVPAAANCVPVDTLVVDVDGRTPLHHAARYSRVASMLLNETSVETMLSTYDIYGDQPLHMALRGNDGEAPLNLLRAMEAILGRPATEAIVRAPNAAGDFPAHLCHFLQVWYRIQGFGADALVRNAEGALPLHTNAAYDGTAEDGALLYVLDKIFLAAGMTVNTALDANGRTPLHYAAAVGSSGNVRLLLEAGASADLTDNGGTAPLTLAIENRHFTLVPIFSEVAGGSPLRAAVKLARIDVIEVLVFNMSIPVDGQDPTNGRTGLFEAAQFGLGNIVDWFLDQGVDPTRLDDFGESVLAVAIANHQNHRYNPPYGEPPSVVARLLDRGAPARQTLAHDSTALHTAARHGVTHAVDELLVHGAQVDFVDFWGRSAMHVCSTADAAEALLRGGAHQIRTDDVPDDLIPGLPAPMEGRAMNAHGFLPLHSAALNGHAGVVHTLLAWRRSAVNDTSNLGNTALHLAAMAGRDEVVRTLLQWCAPAEARNDAGYVPRQVASSPSTRAILEESDRSPGRCQCDCGVYELDAVYAATEWGNVDGATCKATVRCQLDGYEEEETIYCRGFASEAARWLPSETELPCALAQRAVSRAAGRQRPSATSGAALAGAMLGLFGLSLRT